MLKCSLKEPLNIFLCLTYGYILLSLSSNSRIMNEATRHFILRHVSDDVHLLAFQAAKYPDVDMMLAIRQITGMQKVKHKIPAFYECENLLFPARLSLEQSSSEITAKHKSALCEGKTIIDLTGGFGVDAYFFSFRFDRVIYVERQEELCKIAKHNFKALNRKNIQVICDNAENQLDKTSNVDWIYLDPARRTDTGKKAVLLSDCEPNVAVLSEKLLSKSDKVMIKLSPMIDIATLTKELAGITEIHIIAVENECREVIAVMEHQKSDHILIKTTNYTNKNHTENLCFHQIEEQTAQINAANQLCKYLYEPNAAIMKSGAFKLVSDRFRIHKLHVNSHLYTSDLLINDFPGRIFRIEKAYEFKKKSIREFQSEIKKANLSIRNFPLSVSELRNKLKLQEGGNVYVFATTLYNDTKVLISTKKIKEHEF